MGRLVTDSLPPVFSPQDGDIEAPWFAAAVSLTRQVGNKQQRVIVMGDADYLSDLRLSYNIFFNDFYSWFDYGEYPVSIPGPNFMDNLLTVTEPTVLALKTICIWVLPGLLLAAGTILLIRRKRK